MLLRIGSAGPEPISSEPDRLKIAQVEFDINTSAEDKLAVGVPEHKSLFGEFVAVATKMAEKNGWVNR
jgi:hypothetical protein